MSHEHFRSLATQIFVPKLLNCKSEQQRKHKTLHYWAFAKETDDRWIALTKGQKTFQHDDSIMTE